MSESDPSLQIDVNLVRRLVAAQFGQWCHLPVEKVEPGGWDNRTFRLGETLAVRLPSASRYTPQIEKEHRWLPVLAPHLPVAIPESLAVGSPGEGYPWPWSVRRWIDGEPATLHPGLADDHRLADDLGDCLAALARIDATGGPRAGAHSFHRGGVLANYDDEVRRVAGILSSAIDTNRALAVWQDGLDAGYTGKARWVHGDLSPGNILLAEGRLTAVIDFGCMAVGDPACDFAIGWTSFNRDVRARFKQAAGCDEAMWHRGRCWALWKALIVLARLPGTDEREIDRADATLHAVLHG